MVGRSAGSPRRLRSRQGSRRPPRWRSASERRGPARSWPRA